MRRALRTQLAAVDGCGLQCHLRHFRHPLAEPTLQTHSMKVTYKWYGSQTCRFGASRPRRGIDPAVLVHLERGVHLHVRRRNTWPPTRCHWSAGPTLAKSLPKALPHTAVHARWRSSPRTRSRPAKTTGRKVIWRSSSDTGIRVDTVVGALPSFVGSDGERITRGTI